METEKTEKQGIDFVFISYTTLGKSLLFSSQLFHCKIEQGVCEVLSSSHILWFYYSVNCLAIIELGAYSVSFTEKGNTKSDT